MKLDVKAFAIAFAIIWGGSVLLVGIANAVWPPYGAGLLSVAASIYPGYDVTGTIGSIVTGTLYGLVDGAVGGAIFAWLYNLFARLNRRLERRVDRRSD